MSFLNAALRSVNALLSPTGIELKRTHKLPWRLPGSVATAQVGRYSIEVATINPVAWHYSQFPNLASHLGRLTSLLRSKYPGLGAVDVGANVGDTACIIKTAEDIPVLCIEGEAFTFRFLEKNILQFGGVTAHQLFLGEKTEMTSMAFENIGWNLTLKPRTGLSAKPIKLTSLDDFMASQNGKHIFKLLKIDTEGFDCSIIRGATAFIGDVGPAITFEYNRGNMDAIGEPGLPTLFKLEELGYSHIIFHDQNGRFLLSSTLKDHVLIKDLHNYADCVDGRIGYLDITVFHANDTDLAETFVRAERTHQITTKTLIPHGRTGDESSTKL